MEQGEKIRIQYLSHSAFLCETSHRLLLFDIGRVPPRPASLEPDWDTLVAKGKPIIIFSSHDHVDHFDPAWQKRCDETAGCRFIAGEFGRSTGNTIRVNPGEDRIIDDFRIITTSATDKGVAAILIFPEISIYFGGDHAIWDDLPEYQKPYRTSMDRLARTGIHPDLVFLPVSTSDGYQEDALIDGCRLAMTRLLPDGVFPMHAFSYEAFYPAFSQRVKDLAIPVAPVRQSGDQFSFDGTTFIPLP